MVLLRKSRGGQLLLVSRPGDKPQASTAAADFQSLSAHPTGDILNINKGVLKRIPERNGLAMEGF